jgi:hypothetical protein
MFSNLPLTASDLLIMGGTLGVFLARGFLVFPGRNLIARIPEAAFS